MKGTRQEKILQLIQKYPIQTQDELQKYLLSEGITATQATISRDIRELKLYKGMTATGEYKYILPTETKEATIPKFSSAITDSIVKVDFAGNLLVIKTYPGMAPAVGSCVDSLSISGILGSVAGDDAVLVVVRDEALAKELCDNIAHMIRAL
ncbi:MAG: arginine repressor [Clostridia bacterium]|nr:arginine repressor [Clostridia bacterium]